MEELIEKIEKWIEFKLSEPRSDHNIFTYEYDSGYQKALKDILKLINILKK